MTSEAASVEDQAGGHPWTSVDALEFWGRVQGVGPERAWTLVDAGGQSPRRQPPRGFTIYIPGTCVSGIRCHPSLGKGTGQLRGLLRARRGVWRLRETPERGQRAL